MSIPPGSRPFALCRAGTLILFPSSLNNTGSDFVWAIVYKVLPNSIEHLTAPELQLRPRNLASNSSTDSLTRRAKLASYSISVPQCPTLCCSVSRCSVAIKDEVMFDKIFSMMVRV
jgi:hypothetical protein